MKEYRVLEKATNFGKYSYFYPQYKVKLLFGLIQYWSNFVNGDSNVLCTKLEDAKQYIHNQLSGKKHKFKIIHKI